MLDESLLFGMMVFEKRWKKRIGVEVEVEVGVGVGEDEEREGEGEREVFLELPCGWGGVFVLYIILFRIRVESTGDEC